MLGRLTLGRICRYAGSEPNDEVRCVIGARGLRGRAEQNAHWSVDRGMVLPKSILAPCPKPSGRRFGAPGSLRFQ
jgi:hypothetical protein